MSSKALDLITSLLPVTKYLTNLGRISLAHCRRVMSQWERGWRSGEADRQCSAAQLPLSFLFIPGMCLLHEFRSCPQKYKPFTYISTISLNKFIQKISETNKKFRGGEGRRRGEKDLSLLMSSWCIVWELGKRYITFITTSIYPLIS